MQRAFLALRTSFALLSELLPFLGIIQIAHRHSPTQVHEARGMPRLSQRVHHLQAIRQHRPSISLRVAMQVSMHSHHVQVLVLFSDATPDPLTCHFPEASGWQTVWIRGNTRRHVRLHSVRCIAQILRSLGDPLQLPQGIHGDGDSLRDGEFQQSIRLHRGTEDDAFRRNSLLQHLSKLPLAGHVNAVSCILGSFHETQ